MRWMAAVLLSIFAGCAAAYPSVNQASVVYPEGPGSAQLLRTEFGTSLGWSKFPIHIGIDPTMPAKYQLAVEEAVLTWNSLVGNDFLIIDNGHLPLTPSSSGRIVVIRRNLDISPETNTRLLGEAVINSDGSSGNINDVVIHLDYDLEDNILLIVVIHELGHAIGLRHDVNDPMSTMFPSIWDPRAQRVQEQDVTEIRSQIPNGLPVAIHVEIEPVSDKWKWDWNSDGYDCLAVPSLR